MTSGSIVQAPNSWNSTGAGASSGLPRGAPLSTHLVSRLQPYSNLNEQQDSFLERDGPAGDPLGERLSFDELHDQEECVSGFLEPVKRGDIRMIQSGQKLCLALETIQTFLIL